MKLLDEIILAMLGKHNLIITCPSILKFFACPRPSILRPFTDRIPERKWAGFGLNSHSVSCSFENLVNGPRYCSRNTLSIVLLEYQSVSLTMTLFFWFNHYCWMEDLNNFMKVLIQDIFAGVWPTYQTFNVAFLTTIWYWLY